MQQIVKRYYEECYRTGIPEIGDELAVVGTFELARIARLGGDVTYVLTGQRKKGLTGSERKLIEEYRMMDQDQKQHMKTGFSKVA